MTLLLVPVPVTPSEEITGQAATIHLKFCDFVNIAQWKLHPVY